MPSVRDFDDGGVQFRLWNLGHTLNLVNVTPNLEMRLQVWTCSRLRMESATGATWTRTVAEEVPF